MEAKRRVMVKSEIKGVIIKVSMKKGAPVPLPPPF
jgi:hypothetical protein